MLSTSLLLCIAGPDLEEHGVGPYHLLPRTPEQRQLQRHRVCQVTGKA